jgi:hypothetical protein
VQSEPVKILAEDINPSSNYGDSLSDVFLSPFADAFQATKGEMAKVSLRSREVILKTVNGSLSLIASGFFKKRFQKIDDYVKDRMSAIEKDPRYQDAWKRITPHAETALMKMMFMADPVRFITTEIAKRSAVKALETSISLVNELDAQSVVMVGQKIDRRRRSRDKAYEFMMRDLLKKNNIKVSREGTIRSKYDTLLEQEMGMPQISDEIAAYVLKDPDFVRLLEKSAFVVDMEKELRHMGAKVSEAYMGLAEQLANAQSLADLGKRLGIRLGDNMFQGLSKNEVIEAEKIAMSQLKISAYKRLMESLIVHLERVGLDDQKDSENPYRQALISTLRRIQSLLN